MKNLIVLTLVLINCKNVSELQKLSSFNMELQTQVPTETITAPIELGLK